MKSLMLVIIGGALGSALRYVMANYFYHHLGREFPWGTLIVNLTGCFLIGFMFVFLVTRFHAQASL